MLSFCQWKLKKKGPLKDFVNPLFISISLASFSTDWCEKKRKSRSVTFVFTGVILYLVSYCHLPSSLDVNFGNLLSLQRFKKRSRWKWRWVGKWSTRQKKSLLGLRGFFFGWKGTEGLVNFWIRVYYLDLCLYHFLPPLTLVIYYRTWTIFPP